MLCYADACRHHPGAPFFHDAYKGWSCCNKKCTDFTEFLNMKGCTLAKHSNIKPPEPEKPQKVQDDSRPEIKEAEPILAPSLERPPFETPMVFLHFISLYLFMHHKWHQPSTNLIILENWLNTS